MKYALTGLAAAAALAAVALTPATADAGWRGGYWGGGWGPGSAFMWVRAPITATTDMVMAIAPITVTTVTLIAMGPAGIAAGMKPRKPLPGAVREGPPGIVGPVAT